MKILVISDTHGCVEAMAELFFDLKPDMLLHLGDHDTDALELKKRVGGVPVHIVRGNCDFRAGSPDSLIVDVGGLRLFMSHGHRYGVKHSLDALLLAAKYEAVDAALFGHTHRALYARHGALQVINPGSFGYGGSYAVLEIDGGVLTAEIAGGGAHEKT